MKKREILDHGPPEFLESYGCDRDDSYSRGKSTPKAIQGYGETANIFSEDGRRLLKLS